MEKFIIYKDFNSIYLLPMVNLANARFGENYIDSNSILNYMENSKGVCTIAINNKNELLGFCLFYGETLSNTAKKLKIPMENMLNIVGVKDNICIAKSIVLKKSVERMGIANELLKRNLEKAKIKNYNHVFAAAWNKGNEIPAEKVSKKNGFKFLKTSEALWINEKKYKCIVCNGTCKCSANIYYKTI